MDRLTATILLLVLIAAAIYSEELSHLLSSTFY